MKSSRIIVWVAGVAIVGLLLGGGAIYALLRPLGPSLRVTPPTATLVPRAATLVPPTATSVPPEATSVPPTATSVPPEATPTDQPAQTAGACGRQGSMVVMLLGENHPTTPLRGVDAIRLLKVDYDAKVVRVLPLPQELWVNTPQLAWAGTGAATLTSTYYEAKELSASDERARMAYATNVLAQTLADNFYFVPDHYISLSQATFDDLIASLDGIEIDVPQDVDGTPFGYPYFYAGRQVMDGEAALDYMRIGLSAYGPSSTGWEWLRPQDQVLAALQAQLLRPETLLVLPDLIGQFYRNVVTDLSLNQFLALNCMLQATDVSIEHLAFDAGLVILSPDDVLLPKTAQVIDFLDTAFMQ